MVTFAEPIGPMAASFSDMGGIHRASNDIESTGEGIAAGKGQLATVGLGEATETRDTNN